MKRLSPKMGRDKLTKTLNVYLNKFLVGHLNKESSGAINFKYDKEWIKTNYAISNSLPVDEVVYRGEVVIRFFDNLLPDNDDIKKLVATKFGAESTRPFDLLSVIGRDCVGALTFIPEGLEVPDFEADLKFKSISEAEIAKRIRELGSKSPLGMDDGDFRLSIAGAQEKTALLKIKNKWCDPIGITPTTHILKKSIGALNLTINFKDSIDNEWASLYLMKKMGLNCCNVHIESFEDQRVLAVERFDRRWAKNKKGENVLYRIPQEDFCQVFGISPYHKYQKDGGPGIQEISNFLKISTEKEDRKKFLKAIMVFDLLHAIDGHAKNFSVFLETTGVRITPFYDVMSGYFLSKSGQLHENKLRLAMNVGNSGHYNFKRILKRHYEETFIQCGFSKADFEEIGTELKTKYENLKIEDSELDPHLNRATLEIILEGMRERSSKIL